MKVSGTVEKSDGQSIWNSTTNKHMKEWRLQPHRWCLLGHYPAWMCLDVTNFAIILPLNSVPEKKKHIFLHQKIHRNARKTKYQVQKCEKNRAPFFVEILQNYPMFASSLIPAKKGSHLIITVLPACGCQSATNDAFPLQVHQGISRFLGFIPDRSLVKIQHLRFVQVVC